VRFTRSAGKSKSKAPRGTPPYVLSAAETLEKHVITTQVNLLKGEVASLKGDNNRLEANLAAERTEKEAAVGESLELRKAIQDYLDAVEVEAAVAELDEDEPDTQCPSLYLTESKGRGRTGYYLVRCVNDVHPERNHSDDFTSWDDDTEYGRMKETKR
jgi:hypothetical protein